MVDLHKEKDRILEESGFILVGEIYQGLNAYKHKKSLCDFLFAPSYGKFYYFELVFADNFEEACELRDEHGIIFQVKSEEQVKTILNSL